jgi:hypothetical protein
VLRIACFPSVDEEGRPAIESHWADTEDVNLPKDTFVILVAGKNHEEKGGEVSEAALNEVFSWLRITSKQWWIGRPTEAISGNLHFVIPLKKGGHAKDQPWATGRQVAPNEGTVRVSCDIWSDALDKVSNGVAPNHIDTILSDAIYYYFTRDFRTAILLSCSIAELERDRIIADKKLSKNDLKAADTDVLKQLSLGFGGALGRNMAVEAPMAFSFLRACWAARGLVAHGKPLVWNIDGKILPFTDYPADEFLSNLDAVKVWLNSIT